MEPVKKYITIGTKTLFTHYCDTTDHVIIDNRGLHLPEQACYEPADILFSDPGLDLRDLAIDECGTVYILDGGRGRILVQDTCRGPFLPIGCPPGTLPIPLKDPHSLGIDRCSLYIGDGNRIIALSRRNLQVRWIIDRSPEGAVLQTIADLAVDRKGHIFALESDRVHILDRGGRILGRINLPGTATDLAMTPDGGFAALGPQFLCVITKEMTGQAIRNGTPVQPQPCIILGTDPAAGLTAAENGTFIMGNGTSRTPEPALFRVDPATPGIYPRVTSYRGFTRRLAADKPGNIYLIPATGDALILIRQADSGAMQCPIPDPQGTFTGTYRSKRIDSRSPDTRWHRFVINGTFPVGTGIGLEYAVSNEPFPVEWHDGLPGPSAGQGVTKRDGLFLTDEKGRYLWICIRLRGMTALSPVVSRVTMYFPRSTSIEFLPALYQEDEVSSDFVERFLSLFDSTWSEVDDEIDHLARYFDPRATPADFLPWLGSWVALSTDAAWPEGMRRWLIENAIRLYKMRGTPAGLVEVIECYLQEKYQKGRAFIIENLPPPCRISGPECHKCHNEAPPGPDTPGEDRPEAHLSRRECWEGTWEPGPAGKFRGCLYYPPAGVKPVLCTVQAEHWPAAEREMTLSQILFGGALFCFCVLIAGVRPGEAEIQVIRRIIGEWKPAHTCFSVKVLPPGIALDGLTFIGVNTTLDKPGMIIGESVLGRGAVLTDLEDGGRLAPPVRMGTDSRLR